jgi:AraC-like DNA-binding protein
MPATSTTSNGVVARVVVYGSRPGVRRMVQAGLPRRQARTVMARTIKAFRASFRTDVVDAAVVDLDAPGSQSDEAASFAREFPTVAFFGLTSFRSSDAARIASCAALNFAEVLAERIDAPLLSHGVLTQAFSTRFAQAFAEAPPELGLESALQVAAWRHIIAHAGRVVRTGELAARLKITREHLSRSFSAKQGPTLKRVIDLVRLLAAAELAKNPGYDVGDVARVLGYASSSHLSTTAQRVVGTKASSLASLRAVDVIGRFRVS